MISTTHSWRLMRGLSCLALITLSACSIGGGYTQSFDTDQHVKASLGDDVYAWATWESPVNYSGNGQNLGSVDLYGFGLGAKKPPLFIEFGYYHPEISPNPVIEREVITYTLQHDFGPVPFPPSNVRYSLRGDWGTKVGVGYWGERIALTAAYRALRLREKYEIWDSERTLECDCWWVELHSKDASGLEAGIYFRF